MRIGIDATCWSNRRGFGRFTRELLHAVAALDTGDEYVLFADAQSAAQAQFPSPWRVVIGETSVSPVEAASAASRRSLRDVWIMRRAVRREGLDVMFFPAVYSYFPVAGSVPCLVTFHDVIAETLPELVFQTKRSRWFWSLKCRLALRRADRVLTVSPSSKQGLMRRFRVSERRIRVVPEAPSAIFRPPACDKETLRVVLARHGIDPQRRYLLYVGGISPHKNLGRLIDALARLAAEPGQGDLRLVLVGDYAGDVFRTCYDELRSRAAEAGVAARVHFPGYVADADLVYVYAAAHVFVFPSFLEGFGLPVVEAMACGAPVVASRAGSLPEVLDGAGALFDPHDTADLVACLRRVLQDPAYRVALRRRSLRRAQDFSWAQSARKVVDVCHEFRRSEAT